MTVFWLRESNRHEKPIENGKWCPLNRENSCIYPLRTSLSPKDWHKNWSPNIWHTRFYKTPHLKRRGVHDVFHASLLHIHVPNDNPLFPGWMDTQISSAEGMDGEWAVDHILSHSDSHTDSMFEIKWASGDITWLPYYQITHRQALTDYLELLEITQISKLPKETRHPPLDDPRIFVGSITPIPPTSSCFPLPDYTQFSAYLTQSIQSLTLFIQQLSPPLFTSVTLDLVERA